MQRDTYILSNGRITLWFKNLLDCQNTQDAMPAWLVGGFVESVSLLVVVSVVMLTGSSRAFASRRRSCENDGRPPMASVVSRVGYSVEIAASLLAGPGYP